MAARRKNIVADPNEVPNEDQYVFTSMLYDSKMKKNTKNPTCGCKEAKTTYLLKYHFDRLRESAGHLGWYAAQKTLKKETDLYNRIEYAVCNYKKETGHKGPYKVRILLRYHGNLQFDVQPIITLHKHTLLFPESLDLYHNRHEAASTSSLFKVVLDVLPTNPNIHTKDKTHLRMTYDYSRLVAGIESYQDAKEVLLFNQDGEVMDGSITTPYFYRNGQWVTPQNSCGGQIGTTRRYAIDQSLCTLGVIKADSLRHGEVIWLSNAVKGFFTAKFVETTGGCSPPNYRSASTSSSSSDSSHTAVGTPNSECSPVPSPKAML